MLVSSVFACALGAVRACAEMPEVSANIAISITSIGYYTLKPLKRVLYRVDYREYIVIFGLASRRIPHPALSAH